MQKNEQLKILFVDSDKTNINQFISCFGSEYYVFPALSAPDAYDIFQRHGDIGMVLTEQNIEGYSGVELIERIHGKNEMVIGIIITTAIDVSDLLDAVNKGRVFHYILKPWGRDQLRMVLDQAGELLRKTRDCQLTREKLANTNKILTAENTRLKASEGHLHHLAAHLLTVHEQERNRIAVKLQSELGEALGEFKRDISSAKQQLHQGKEAGVEEQLKMMSASLNRLVDEVNRLSTSLNLGIIDELGLDAALEKLVATFSRHYRLHCSFEPVEINRFFSAYRQRVIYRLFQESLINVVKHAEATRIKIDMQNLDGDIIIRITDNGKGFAVGDVMLRSADIRGIGLSAMAERARMLAGKMEIISKPGQGTSVVFVLPADASEDDSSASWIDGSLQFI